jgi:hypothetical protein
MLYQTKLGLRKAVEKRLGHSLAKEQWWLLKPELEPPYNEYDIEDILSGLPDYEPKPEKKKATIKPILKALKNTQRPSITALDARPSIRYYRKHILGLEKPVPIENMETVLRNTIVKELEPPSDVLCPIMLHSFQIEGRQGYSSYVVDIFRVHRVTFSYEWDAKTHFSEIVSHYSSLYHCHPALIVLLILGDIPFNRYHGRRLLSAGTSTNILAVIDGEQISLIIPHIQVPSSVISKVYNLARETSVDTSENPQRQSKPRFETERIQKLLLFVQLNPLSWKERFSLWNAENPQWSYRTVYSMQSAVYNAYRRIGVVRKSDTKEGKGKSKRSEK